MLLKFIIALEWTTKTALNKETKEQCQSKGIMGLEILKKNDKDKSSSHAFIQITWLPGNHENCTPNLQKERRKKLWIKISTNLIVPQI